MDSTLSLIIYIYVSYYNVRDAAGAHLPTPWIFESANAFRPL